jgi:hypothetical protein
MSKKHDHKECEHKNLKYCKKCDVIYCEDCDREWIDNGSIINWSYPIYDTDGWIYTSNCHTCT